MILLLVSPVACLLAVCSVIAVESFSGREFSDGQSFAALVIGYGLYWWLLPWWTRPVQLWRHWRCKRQQLRLQGHQNQSNSSWKSIGAAANRSGAWTHEENLAIQKALAEQGARERTEALQQQAIDNGLVVALEDEPMETFLRTTARQEYLAAILHAREYMSQFDDTIAQDEGGIIPEPSFSSQIQDCTNRQVAETIKPQPSRRVRRVDYHDYLTSDAWHAKRTLALQRAGHRCQLCSSHSGPLNVHHNSYERLGDEEQEDLIVLCRDCHQRFHGR